MKKFIPDEHYAVVATDVEGGARVEGAVKFKAPALELIASYYHDKYDTNINFPISTEQDDLVYLDAFGFFENKEDCIKHFRESCPESASEYRYSILLGATSEHAIPLMYMKSQGQEYLFIANSMGVDLDWAEFAADKDMQTVVLSEGRQADQFSCFTDAMYFCKQMTEKNQHLIKRKNIFHFWMKKHCLKN